MTLPVHVRASRYTVSCIPPEYGSASLAFTIAIERRGSETWAVTRLGQYLARNGTWDEAPARDDQTRAWWGDHLFDLATALEMAKAAAPNIVVNECTPADIIAHHELPKGARWADPTKRKISP